MVTDGAWEQQLFNQIIPFVRKHKKSLVVKPGLYTVHPFAAFCTTVHWGSFGSKIFRRVNFSVVFFSSLRLLNENWYRYNLKYFAGLIFIVESD